MSKLRLNSSGSLNMWKSRGAQRPCQGSDHVVAAQVTSSVLYLIEPSTASNMQITTTSSIETALQDNALASPMD